MDRDWVIAPIPTHDPSQGFGLELVAQYIFRSKGQKDSTPPSIAMAGAFYTEENSWGVLVGYLGHWREDSWRVAAGAGYADVNYDYYGTGTDMAEAGLSIPLGQQVTAGFAQALVRVVPHFYAGVRAIASQVDVSTTWVDQPPVVLPAGERQAGGYAGGLVAQWDTRDNQFFPQNGSLGDLSATFNDGDHAYQVYQADWNTYQALTPRQVLAFRAYARAAFGDVPFYGLSQFGRGNDLRGFKSGQYRDRSMMAIQLEYRLKLNDRWGAVLFGGFGEVAPALDRLNAKDLLTSGGAGLRFRLSKTNPVNFRFDWAYGPDGDTTYLGVNEAF